MRRHLVSAAILATAAAAMAFDVPLTYVKHGGEGPSFQPGGYALLEESTKPPPGTWKLPLLTAKLPVYALLELGGTKRLLVFDAKQSGDPFYTRLWLDANGNNDLTDDPELELLYAEDQRPSNVAEFRPVEVSLPCRGGAAPYRIGAFAYFMGSLAQGNLNEHAIRENKLRVFASCECSYQGRFDLDGTTYYVALNDRNANGTFDDKNVFVTADGATELAGDILFLAAGVELSYEKASSLLFGGQLVLKDKLYDVAVDLAAKALRVTPSAAQVVKVEFPGMDIDQMTIEAEGGAPAIMLFKPGTAARIPAGSYRPLEYGCLRKDAEGDVWSVSAEARPDTPFLKIDATNPRLAFGEPYTVRAAVPKDFYKAYPTSESRALELELQIVGSARERATDLRHVSGDKTTIARDKQGYRPIEPSYTLRTTDGEIAGKGSFAYG